MKTLFKMYMIALFLVGCNENGVYQKEDIISSIENNGIPYHIKQGDIVTLPLPIDETKQYFQVTFNRVNDSTIKVVDIKELSGMYDEFYGRRR